LESFKPKSNQDTNDLIEVTANVDVKNMFVQIANDWTEESETN